MNKEYIERNALIQTIEHNSKYPIIKIIKEIKAADVKPVVRGEWMLIGADDNDMPIYRCSVCGTKRFGRDYYCGHCGTKMKQ